jgi:hypothetical protein
MCDRKGPAMISGRAFFVAAPGQAVGAIFLDPGRRNPDNVPYLFLTIVGI